ncbi:putative holin-like toxin [Veillonella sp. 3913]|nr:putative holin-like toxin [Veillonella sp. 3913]
MTVFEALMIVLTSCTLVVLLITCIVMIIALIK